MSSRLRFPVAVFCTAALLFMAPAGALSGQLPRQPPQKPALVNASGTIEAVAPGFIRIKSVTGQPWLLQVQRGAHVQVTGTAKADVLRAGTFISFVAEVDKRRGRVEGKVGKLTVFTPSPQRPLGAFPDQGDPGDAEQSAPFGADPLAEGRARRRQPKSNKDIGPPVERFEIVARITAIDKKGKLTVYTPNRYFKPAIQIELTEEPEIELDLAGPTLYSLAKPGDQVHARGKQVAPNVVQVRDVTIHLAEPFTTVQAQQPNKKPPRRTTRSSRRKRDEAEEPEEAVEPEKDKDEQPGNRAGRL